MIAYIALGSNLNDRKAYLRDALHRILDHGEITKLSNVYESVPVGVLDQPAFLNVVVECETTLTPPELLKQLKKIEVDLGRLYRGKWKAREIDLDIIVMGSVLYDDVHLSLPHPEAHKRSFVMRPLADIAPKLMYPGINRTAKDIADSLKDEGLLGTVAADWTPPLIDVDLVMPVCPYRHFEDCDVERLFANSGVLLRDVFDPAVNEEWLNAARELFALGPEVLNAHKRTPGKASGYTPPGVEGVRYRGPSFSRHFYDFNPGDTVPLERFRVCMEDAWQKLLVTAAEIVKKLNQGECDLAESMIGSGSHIRVAQYLNDEVNPLKVLFPAHLDWSLLTLFVGGVHSGLSVQCDGRWYRVAIPAGALFVGAGSTFHHYYPYPKALRHRVMAESLERISMFLFAEPRLDVVLPSGERVGDLYSRLEKQTRKDT